MTNANIAYLKSVIYKEALDSMYVNFNSCYEAYTIYKQAYEESKKQLGRLTELDAKNILIMQDMNAEIKKQKVWGKWKGWLMFGAGGSLMYFIMK